MAVPLNIRTLENQNENKNIFEENNSFYIFHCHLRLGIKYALIGALISMLPVTYLFIHIITYK